MVQHDVPDWNSITDGTKLYAGGYVYHAGHTWRSLGFTYQNGAGRAHHRKPFVAGFT